MASSSNVAAPLESPATNTRLLSSPPDESSSPSQGTAATFSPVIINVEPAVQNPEQQPQDRLFGLLRTTAAVAAARGPPPSYEEANNPSTLGPPPSYDSLFGRVREVRKTSDGFWDFSKNLFFYLLGKIGLMVIIGITIIVPICMLVLGGIYVNDCPAEHYIPVYLIVGGACGLLKLLLSLKIRSRRSREANLEVPDSSFGDSLQSLINSFLICWFITGCYWVYGAYEPNYYDPSAPNYCSHALYGFAFWLLSSTFIFIALVIVLLCCISGTALIWTSDRT